MADHTSIEWAEATWNPTTGCDRVSPGCDNCYALTLAKRLKAMGSAKYQTDGDPRTSGPGFGLAIHPDALTIPLRWREPRRVFVNSMSDLFHDRVPQDFIARVFAVMAATPEHTYQLLTKRHSRMRYLLSWGTLGGEGFPDMVEEAMAEFTHAGLDRWPLPNVWTVVSVENQHWLDIRSPALADTPAAVRGLSLEPLLGPIDLGLDDHAPWSYTEVGVQCHCGSWMVRERCPRVPDWVIVGGESGPGARPMHPDWARSLRDQCVEAGVPFFFKQIGEWTWVDGRGRGVIEPDLYMNVDGRIADEATALADGGEWKGLWRLGKKAAGRELDGRTWNEYPTAVRA